MAKSAAEVKDSKDEKKPEFSEREVHIMTAAWKCVVDGEPKINYEKLAAALGMSNTRSANNAWATIKKKIFTDGTIDGTTPKATPRKRGKKGTVEGDEGQEDEGTPAKKAKTPAKRGKKAAEKEDEGEKRDSASPIKGEPMEEDGDA